MSNIDKNKMNNWIKDNKDMILNLMKEVSKTKNMTFDTVITEEHNVSDLILAEEFPRYGIQFTVSDTDLMVNHFISLDVESVNTLYLILSGKTSEEKITEEQIGAIQVGFNDLLNKISSLSSENNNGIFSFGDHSFSKFESADNIEKILTNNDGVYLVHNLSIGKDKLILNHYCWSKTKKENMSELLHNSQSYDTNNNIFTG